MLRKLSFLVFSAFFSGDIQFNYNRWERAFRVPALAGMAGALSHAG